MITCQSVDSNQLWGRVADERNLIEAGGSAPLKGVAWASV